MEQKNNYRHELKYTIIRSEYLAMRGRLKAIMQTDPTAFYTYDEYLEAAPMLLKTIKLRSESVAGQLDGTIPSTDEDQRKDSSSLIDASEIDIKVMGEFGMGGGGGFGGFGGSTDDSSESSSNRPSRGDREMPSSFSGMPGQGASGTQISNAITYGVCFAVMIVALIAVSCIKRK